MMVARIIHVLFRPSQNDRHIESGLTRGMLHILLGGPGAAMLPCGHRLKLQ